MSKKIAEGSNALVLDVKCGSGAFMKTLDDARALARSLVAIGTRERRADRSVHHRMDAPLGSAVGNALEIAECVDTLRGRGPPDLAAIVERLAARMVQLGGGAGSDEEALSARARGDRLRRRAGQVRGDDRATGRRSADRRRSDAAAAGRPAARRSSRRVPAS